MNKNLIIIGAQLYARVAYEIAFDMKCFDNISFVDDFREATPDGIPVIGKIKDLENFVVDYSNIIVALEDAKKRLSLLNMIEEELPFRIVSLISPKAYVSSSSQIMQGCIIEPMAVVHTGCIISKGCFISSGAVINYGSMCCDCSHIECNATISERSIVPAGTKVLKGSVFENNSPKINDLFIDFKKENP